jgi:hypothetical protein
VGYYDITQLFIPVDPYSIFLLAEKTKKEPLVEERKLSFLL